MPAQIIIIDMPVYSPRNIGLSKKNVSTMNDSLSAKQ